MSGEDSHENLGTRIRLQLSNIESGINVKKAVQEILDIGRTQGFGDESELRFEVYSFLLGIQKEKNCSGFIPRIPSTPKEEDFCKMINRNCNGTFRVIDACLNEDEEHLAQMRKDLEEIIFNLFSENKNYHYFRGYEHFCSIMIWHFGKLKGYQIIQHFSATFLRQDISLYNYMILFLSSICNTDALAVEIDKSIELQVHHIFEIVKGQDNQIAQIFSVTHFLAFCVSWVLTWFAYNIRKSNDLLKIYDFLICSPSEGVVLLGAAFILGTKDIMKEHIQECQEGGEIGVMFGIYQNIWQVEYDLTQIINLAIHLQKQNVFTSSMRQQYGQESIMHEEYLVSKLTYRKHIVLYNLNKMKENLKLFSLIIAVLSIFFAFIYP